MKNKPKPRKQLLTPIGKLVEKISYATVGYYMLGLILGSTIFFCFYGVQSNDVPCNIDFGDALYFSIITFSSLGYGDFTPIGFGKVVAATEVLGGLILIAIFVGKIASERQAALLLLIYTSEQQERISRFNAELEDLHDRLEEAIRNKNHNELAEISKKTYNYISSICSYLIVHANQGDIATFGNISSLRKLYKVFSKLQKTSLQAMRLYGLSQRTVSYFGNTIGILSGNAARMKPFHKSDIIAIGRLDEITSNGKALKNYNKKLETGEIILRSETVMTPELLEKVKQLMNNSDKQRDFHKVVAGKLDISNSLAAKCIKTILGEA